ncbi:MAG TPA: multidrug efflux SMR transporter [Salinisphaeraceae bacterium]|nr:multidrug efflux SMR transporter [Salinisphaeraceae bacterium]
MQSWLLLGLAIVLEVAGTVCMKLSEGLTRVLPIIGIVVFYLLSFAALSIVIKRIDISIAYAVWAGLGIVLITAIGIVAFKEPVTWVRIACIGLIIVGVMGLNLSGARH